MIYRYCLKDKSSPIYADVHQVTTVLPARFPADDYEFSFLVDSEENHEIPENLFGVPDQWVVDFAGGEPTLRFKNEADRLPAAKEAKRNEIKQAWIDSTIKDNPLCYVITTVIGSDINPIVMDCSEKDQNNIRTLLEDMEDNGVSETIIKDFHNNYHQVTIEQVREIKRCINRRGCQLFQTKEMLYAQIAASTTLDEVSQIHWIAVEKHK